jgi:uncharacterized protein with HEPN domain
MPRDARTYLWDALHAADLIVRFVDGRSFTEYQADDLVDRPSSVSSRSSARR